MHFSEPRVHMVPLFTSSKILPLNMLCVQTVSFIKQKESVNMRPSLLLVSIYMNPSRLNQIKDYFPSFGANLWNSICDELCELRNRAFKNIIIYDMFFSLLEAARTFIMKRPFCFIKQRDIQPFIQSINSFVPSFYFLIIITVIWLIACMLFV